MAREWEAYDERLRAAAFAFLRAVQLRTGGPVRFEDVSGFEFEGARIPLLDRQRGIRKPAGLDAALSIRTVHAPRPDQRPYDDAPGPDGYLRYKWRGDDPAHPENVALRRACERGSPLIWFQGIERGLYLPVFPVWLVAEEPAQRQFVVAIDALERETFGLGAHPVESSLRRAYAERVRVERLHQPVFRARVLVAYEHRCAICRLRRVELLDAAHIRPDSEGGEPVVPNGIALCRIHHGAFDAHIVGIRPDYVVEVRPDVLDDHDGPVLVHALQGVHGRRLEVPARRAARPDPALLAERYERFCAVAC
jgi:putative restriction endonuclease